MACPRSRPRRRSSRLNRDSRNARVTRPARCSSGRTTREVADRCRTAVDNSKLNLTFMTTPTANSSWISGDAAATRTRKADVAREFDPVVAGISSVIMAHGFRSPAAFGHSCVARKTEAWSNTTAPATMNATLAASRLEVGGGDGGAGLARPICPTFEIEHPRPAAGLDAAVGVVPCCTSKECSACVNPRSRLRSRAVSAAGHWRQVSIRKSAVTIGLDALALKVSSDNTPR